MHMVGLFGILSPGTFLCVLGVVLAMGRRYAPATLAKVQTRCHACLPGRCAEAVGKLLVVKDAVVDAEGSSSPSHAASCVKSHQFQRTMPEPVVATRAVSAPELSAS